MPGNIISTQNTKLVFLKKDSQLDAGIRYIYTNSNCAFFVSCAFWTEKKNVSLLSLIPRLNMPLGTCLFQVNCYASLVVRLKMLRYDITSY